MRFDFHKYKTFKQCKKHYHLNYVVRKVPQELGNKYFAIVGITVHGFFEDYANKWKNESISWTRSEIHNRLHKIWVKTLKYNSVDWGAPFAKKGPDELYQEALELTVDCLENDDFYENIRSEVKIDLTLKSGDTSTGKIDFIEEVDGYVEIIDGKTSKEIGKGVDPKQLYMYAFLYYAKYGKWPNKLSFYYFRHKVKVDVPFSETLVLSFIREYFNTLTEAKNMLNVTANPSASNCKYCKYKNECEEGLASAENRKRGPRKTIDILADSNAGATGF